MKPEELINLSLQQEVEIEPNTTIPSVDLNTYSLRGCKPLTLAAVPLYIALHLKSLNCCTIRVPKYLNREFLIGLIENEQGSENFIEIPEFLFEHAYIFMNEEIETLIGELKRLRLAKVWKGLKDMDGKALYINGLSKWEFNELKPIVVKAMEIGRRVKDNCERTY